MLTLRLAVQYHGVQDYTTTWYASRGPYYSKCSLPGHETTECSVFVVYLPSWRFRGYFNFYNKVVWLTTSLLPTSLISSMVGTTWDELAWLHGWRRIRFSNDDSRSVIDLSKHTYDIYLNFISIDNNERCTVLYSTMTCTSIGGALYNLNLWAGWHSPSKEPQAVTGWR